MSWFISKLTQVHCNIDTEECLFLIKSSPPKNPTLNFSGPLTISCPVKVSSSSPIVFSTKHQLQGEKSREDKHKRNKIKTKPSKTESSRIDSSASSGGDLHTPLLSPHEVPIGDTDIDFFPSHSTQAQHPQQASPLIMDENRSDRDEYRDSNDQSQDGPSPSIHFTLTSPRPPRMNANILDDPSSPHNGLSIDKRRPSTSQVAFSSRSPPKVVYQTLEEQREAGVEADQHFYSALSLHAFGDASKLEDERFSPDGVLHESKGIDTITNTPSAANVNLETTLPYPSLSSPPSHHPMLYPPTTPSTTYTRHEVYNLFNDLPVRLPLSGFSICGRRWAMGVEDMALPCVLGAGYDFLVFFLSITMLLYRLFNMTVIDNCGAKLFEEAPGVPAKSLAFPILLICYPVFYLLSFCSNVLTASSAFRTDMFAKNKLVVRLTVLKLTMIPFAWILVAVHGVLFHDMHVHTSGEAFTYIPCLRETWDASGNVKISSLHTLIVLMLAMFISHCIGYSFATLFSACNLCLSRPAFKPPPASQGEEADPEFSMEHNREDINDEDLSSSSRLSRPHSRSHSDTLRRRREVKERKARRAHRRRVRRRARLIAALQRVRDDNTTLTNLTQASQNSPTDTIPSISHIELERRIASHDLSPTSAKTFLSSANLALLDDASLEQLAIVRFGGLSNVEREIGRDYENQNGSESVSVSEEEIDLEAEAEIGSDTEQEPHDGFHESFHQNTFFPRSESYRRSLQSRWVRGFERICCCFCYSDNTAREVYESLGEILSTFTHFEHSRHLVASDIAIGLILVQGTQRVSKSMGHQFMVADLDSRWDRHRARRRAAIEQHTLLDAGEIRELEATQAKQAKQPTTSDSPNFCVCLLNIRYAHAELNVHSPMSSSFLNSDSVIGRRLAQTTKGDHAVDHLDPVLSPIIFEGIEGAVGAQPAPEAEEAKTGENTNAQDTADGSEFVSKIVSSRPKDTDRHQHVCAVCKGIQIEPKPSLSSFYTIPEQEQRRSHTSYDNLILHDDFIDEDILNTRYTSDTMAEEEGLTQEESLCVGHVDHVDNVDNVDQHLSTSPVNASDPGTGQVVDVTPQRMSIRNPVLQAEAVANAQSLTDMPSLIDTCNETCNESIDKGNVSENTAFSLPSPKVRIVARNRKRDKNEDGKDDENEEDDKNEEDYERNIARRMPDSLGNRLPTLTPARSCTQCACNQARSGNMQTSTSTPTASTVGNNIHSGSLRTEERLLLLGHDQSLVSCIARGEQPDLEQEDWERLKHAKYFARFARGAYGWPLFVFDEPKTALCRCQACPVGGGSWYSPSSSSSHRASSGSSSRSTSAKSTKSKSKSKSTTVPAHTDPHFSGKATSSDLPDFSSLREKKDLENSQSPHVKLDVYPSLSPRTELTETFSSSSPSIPLSSLPSYPAPHPTLSSSSPSPSPSSSSSSPPPSPTPFPTEHIGWRCSSSIRSFLVQTESKPEDLLHMNIESQYGTVAYYVSLDHRSKKVVISVRGTLSLADTVTDLDAQACFLPNAPRHYGHKGMVLSSQWLVRELEGQSGFHLQRAMKSRAVENYGVVIVGHSLGAGVATITTVLLAQQFPSIRCFAFAPPLSVDPLLAYKLRGCVTSIVYKHDIVSRLSVTNLFKLKRQIINAFKISARNKFDIMKAAYARKENEMFNFDILYQRAQFKVQQKRERNNHPSHRHPISSPSPTSDVDNTFIRGNSFVVDSQALASDRSSSLQIDYLPQNRNASRFQSIPSANASERTIRRQSPSSFVVDQRKNATSSIRTVNSVVACDCQCHARPGKHISSFQNQKNQKNQKRESIDVDGMYSYLPPSAWALTQKRLATTYKTRNSTDMKDIQQPTFSLSSTHEGFNHQSSSENHPNQRSSSIHSSIPITGMNENGEFVMVDINQSSTLQRALVDYSVGGRIYHIVPRINEAIGPKYDTTWSRFLHTCILSPFKSLGRSSPPYRPDSRAMTGETGQNATPVIPVPPENDILVYPSHPRTLDEIFVSSTCLSDHLPLKTNLTNLYIPGYDEEKMWEEA